VAPVLGITRILAFGDSLTAGTTSPPLTLLPTLTPGLPESYPYKLQELLTARYTTQTIEVMNEGRGARNATADRDRLDTALRAAQPELLLLMEGANDLNNPTLDRLSEDALDAAIQRIVDAMEDMVRDSVKRGVQVMLATLPPQRPDGRRAGGVPYLSRYNEGLKSMAVKKGARIVDLHAEFPVSLLGEDGLHPTEAGYQKIAEIFHDAIAAHYEVVPAARLQP
jgi:lysophospholipase L1-like esterase